MATTKSIKLTDLQVNTENYRFEGVAGQKEAIEKMLEDQKDKLFNLAKHIAENGLNPNDPVQVSPSSVDRSKYNVLEGNRRVVSLKLLSHPDLIDSVGHSALKNNFKKLHDKIKSKLIAEIVCTVYDSPAEAEKWIKLKHTGENKGVGTVTWDTQQIRRFDEKVEGKSFVSLQIINMLHAAPNVPHEVKSQLSKLKITNLDRLISDPKVRNFLGIYIAGSRIQSDVDQGEVVKGLTQIAKSLLDPKFNVKKIYTKQDRNRYLRGFPKSHQPDIQIKSEKPWQLGGTSGSMPQTVANKKINSRERKALIPKTFKIGIDNPKVNAIYGELQKLDAENFKNATAVLFRVFVELSIDCYREKNSLSKTPSSGKEKINLQKKIFEVADHLETLKKADAGICKGIKTSVQDNNSVLGIDTWHAYIHNNKFSPIPQNLMTAWDNIQSFMEKVWDTN